MKRIPVQLTSEHRIDKTLLATLNRFHFKTIYLDTQIDYPEKLNYVDTIPHAEDNVVFMCSNADGVSQTLKEGKKVVKKDYLKELSRYFHRYLRSTDRVPNSKLQNDEQAIPSVDMLADQFEADLIEQFEITPVSPPPNFAVAFTHDVDFFGTFLAGQIKTGLYFLFNALRTLNSPGTSLFYLKNSLRYLLTSVDYYGIEKILEIAKEKKFQPVFFMYAELAGGNNMSRSDKIIYTNPNYRLTDKILSRAIAAIKEAGAEIGLHGSYKSGNNQELFEAEKKYLEEITGIPCKSTRQHYLRIFAGASQQIYSQTGIEFESTCGFIQDNAFFCGTTRPFYSVLPGEKQNQVVVVPMVFMDAVPLYYKPKSVNAILDELVNIFQKVKKFNGFVSINFHQRMFSALPEYPKLYEDLAIEVKKMGGEISPLRELDQLFPTSFP